MIVTLIGRNGASKTTVPEERRVLPNLTVYDNLRLAMLGAGVTDEDGTLLAEVFDFFPRLKAQPSMTVNC